MPSSPEAKGLLLQNPDLFLLHYFPDVVQELKPFHVELIELALYERMGLELYPAGHGKTTLVSELLPIYEICRNPNTFLALVLKNQQDSRAIVRSIQNKLVTNQALIEDFGPFEGSGSWSLDRFDVAKRTRPGKSSTLAAFGAQSRDALGYRSDHITLDDVVTDRNSTTPEQREKLEEWFNQGPLTSAADINGRITVVGTAFHPADLYATLADIPAPEGEGTLWTCKIQQAILDWETKEVLWPEWRPYLWLLEKKLALGTIDFNKRYQNLPIDPTQMAFRDEYIRGGYLNGEKYPGCLDRHYRLGDFDEAWPVFRGFDPAIGLSKNRKFCADITIAVGSCQEHERCLWVIDLKRDQMTLPQQVDLIIHRHTQYGAVKTAVEANAYQRGLYQAIQARLEEQGLSLNIVPHITTASNKNDPEIGIQALSPWFEYGRVHIPWGDAPSRQRMQIFVDELITYPGKTTDTVMAFWMAFLMADQTAPKYRSFVRQIPVYAGEGHNREARYGRGSNPWTTVIKNPYYARPEVPVGSDA